jgi:hypothetical protein
MPPRSFGRHAGGVHLARADHRQSPSGLVASAAEGLDVDGFASVSVIASKEYRNVGCDLKASRSAVIPTIDRCS